MRQRCALFFLVSACLLSVIIPERLSAQETGSDTRGTVSKEHKAADNSRFSVGAGLGFGFESNFSSVSLGYNMLSSSYISVYSPIGTALIEWAISPRLRLVAGATGNYADQVHHSGPEKGFPAPTKRWSAGAAIGARWVLLPGALIEVSPLLLVGGAAGKVSDGVTGYSTDEDGIDRVSYQDDENIGVNGRLGLVFEYNLLPSLYLRFESYFVTISYYKLRSHYRPAGEKSTRTTSANIAVGFGFLPVIQLRLTI